MPSRSSFGFAGSDMQHLGEPRFTPRMVRVLNFLQTTYACVHIVYWFVVGSFLVFLPWQSFWGENYFVYVFPAMRPLLANPFLKFTVLGLGVANLLIGFKEIATLRKTHRGGFPS